jgi:hypothetical protein
VRRATDHDHDHVDDVDYHFDDNDLDDDFDDDPGPALCRHLQRNELLRRRHRRQLLRRRELLLLHDAHGRSALLRQLPLGLQRDVLRRRSLCHRVRDRLLVRHRWPILLWRPLLRSTMQHVGEYPPRRSRV